MGGLLGPDAWGLGADARRQREAEARLKADIEGLRRLVATEWGRHRIRAIEKAFGGRLVFVGDEMAGEIREKMKALRAARAKLVEDMAKEIDAVTAEVAATHADGIEAMKLPRAELESTRQEIREIRAEFAPSSNGAPPGPLPDVVVPLLKPSKGSAGSSSGDGAVPEPQASWGQK